MSRGPSLSDAEQNADEAAKRTEATYTVEFDEKDKPKLPARPKTTRAEQLAWLTVVLAFDHAHPLTGGRHFGGRGGGGVVELDRLSAPTIEFDPASAISNGQKLRETLIWSERLSSDRLPFGWTNGQAAVIADVVSRVCAAAGRRTLADEAESVATTLMHTAEPREGFTTYGGSGARFEAAQALSPDIDDHGRPGRLRYLIDRNTGEYVIRVGDAAGVARSMLGSLRRDWLDGAMTALGWRRVRVEGHALSGRAGRKGPHAGCDAYRGHLRPADDEGTVTT